MSPDLSVWRSWGDPLVAGAGTGPLAGLRVAVKDLYAVAGHRVGAGNPTWLGEADPEAVTAPVVQALLDAGADVAGLAQTDELAYSLAGANAHHGTPPNPRAPGRLPGGSSSGSAAAVALGQADIGLGTDTGGSIRVPAAYQGLWGLRTTHDLVAREGLLPLAPSFDTVGWLTRDAATLAAVGDVLLPPAPVSGTVSGTDQIVVVPSLLALADTDVSTAIDAWADSGSVTTEAWPLEHLATWRTAFQTWQGWEAWQQHGAWVADRLDALGADVRGRFETASRITPAEADRARAVLDAARDTLRELVGDRVLALPSASSVAPPLDADGPAVQAVREATLTLTCVAGIAGLPALGVPLTTAAGLPCGVSLVAGPGRDRDLLTLAAHLGAHPDAESALVYTASRTRAPTRQGVDDFNALSEAEARALVAPCVRIGAWVDAVVTGRPYDDADAAVAVGDAQAATWSAHDVEAALADHPRIGQRHGGDGASAAMSRGEQAGVDPADTDLAARLAEGNRRYEETFGRIYLVRAAGRTAEELLALLEQRLGNDPDTEAEVTREQLAQIAALRLRGLLT